MIAISHPSKPTPPPRHDFECRVVVRPGLPAGEKCSGRYVSVREPLPERPDVSAAFHRGFSAPIALVGALSLIVWLFLPGCSNMGDDSDAVDPPVLNPKPVERVNLDVTAPASLDVHLVAIYEIGHWLGIIGGGGTFCGPESDRNPPPDAMGHPLPRKEVPIDLKWDGRAYTGDFYIDRFLPGRCHWRFVSLSMTSPVEDFVSLYWEHKNNYNFDTTHSHGVYDESPVQSTDLWCRADPAPKPPEHGKTLCTSLDYFVVYPGVVAHELLASVPVDQRTRSALVNIFPSTTSITLRFHDLDAENRAASTSAASAHHKLTRSCPVDGVRIYVDAEGAITVNGAQVAPQDLREQLQRLDPAPRLACYSLASTADRPLQNAIDAVTIIGLLDLPIEVYADNTFKKLASLK
jgi:hypothetical protein